MSLDGSSASLTVDYVRVERQDGIAIVTLDHASDRNALSLGMTRALVEVMGALASDEAVGAIVVAAAGAVFSSGGSVDDLFAPKVPLSEMYAGVVAVAECGLPTVAAVNGPALGAGMNLAMACDLIFCSPLARFETRFPQIGLHPGGGHLWQLRQRIGRQGAAALSLFSEALDGEPEARLRDMDRDGVDVEVLYSELSSFRHFHLVGEEWRVVARAFNDYLADFAAVDPKRLVVSYQLPIIDIDHAIAEVQRLAAIGARSVQLPNYPSELGFADYHDARYDPLWSALEETSISISQHLGPKDSLWDVYRRDPLPQKAIFTSLPSMALAENMAWWILTGILERHPGLRIVFVEPGLGWVPYYLDILDRRVRTYDMPEITELPSEYFRRNMMLTFMDDPRGVAMRHELGVENIMWSTDFPHPATTWPNSQEFVARNFAGVPEEETQLMVCGNAARVYGL